MSNTRVTFLKPFKSGGERNEDYAEKTMLVLIENELWAIVKNKHDGTRSKR